MNKTERFWDHLAKEIDPEHDRLDDLQIKTIKKLSHYIRPDDRVLDYGCARGGIALGLAEHAKEVVGIDISSKMIEIAEKRKAARQLDHVRFFHTTISDKRFEPAKFDVVIALNVIHLTEDPDLVVEQVNKLLKPDGLLITITPCLEEKPGWMNWFVNPLLRVIVQLGFIPAIKFFTMKSFETLLMQSGFQLEEKKSIKESLSLSQFIIAKKRGEAK